MRYHPEPVRPLQLEVNDLLRLREGGHPQRRWTVQAVSEHFAVLMRQTPFRPLGVLQYTVLDWRNGVRGPCDLIGQGWGDGTYSAKECAEMLVDFEYDDEQDPARLAALAAGRTSWSPERWQIHVSQRNWVRLDIFEVNGEPVELVSADTLPTVDMEAYAAVERELDGAYPTDVDLEPLILKRLAERRDA